MEDMTRKGENRSAIDVIAGTIRAWEGKGLGAGRFAEYIIGDLDDYEYIVLSREDTVYELDNPETGRVVRPQ